VEGLLLLNLLAKVLEIPLGTKTLVQQSLVLVTGIILDQVQERILILVSEQIMDLETQGLEVQLQILAALGLVRGKQVYSGLELATQEALVLGKQQEQVYSGLVLELWVPSFLVQNLDSRKTLLVSVNIQVLENQNRALEVTFLVGKRNTVLILQVMEQIGGQVLAVALVNMELARQDFPRRLLDWVLGLDFLGEQHLGLEEPWLLIVLFTSTRSLKDFFMEEDNTIIQMVIGMMMMTYTDTETVITIQIIIGHMKMTIIGAIMKKMNATKDAQGTLTVSGVSVNVTMAIPRSGVDVRVTGALFHKLKSNNSDQLHLIHSSHAAPLWTVSLWT